MKIKAREIKTASNWWAAGNIPFNYIGGKARRPPVADILKKFTELGFMETSIEYKQGMIQVLPFGKETKMKMLFSSDGRLGVQGSNVQKTLGSRKSVQRTKTHRLHRNSQKNIRNRSHTFRNTPSGRTKEIPKKGKGQESLGGTRKNKTPQGRKGSLTQTAPSERRKGKRGARFRH